MNTGNYNCEVLDELDTIFSECKSQISQAIKEYQQEIDCALEAVREEMTGTKRTIN